MAGYIKFNWHGVKIMTLVEADSNRAVRKAAQAILDRANEHVPYEVGTLEGTGTVSVDGSKGAVSYNTVYAARLHQHPEYNFQGKGEGRWLQNAVEERERILKSLALPFRNSLGQFSRRPG